MYFLPPFVLLFLITGVDAIMTLMKMMRINGFVPRSITFCYWFQFKCISFCKLAGLASYMWWRQYLLPTPSPFEQWGKVNHEEIVVVFKNLRLHYRFMKLYCRNTLVYENRINHFRNIVNPLCPVYADTSFYFLRCEDPIDVLLSEAHNNLIVVSRYAKEQASQHSLRALTWNVGQIE